MSITLQLSSFTRKQLYRRLQEAYASGSLKLIKRIHALLALAQDQSVSDVAQMLALGEQTVRDYRNQYLFKGMASLVYKAPPGRPSKLTKTQRQQLAQWIKARPQDSGYTSGCWNTPMIQDLIQRHFGVVYHPHYIATLLKNMGFSYQKARFVSDHLNEAKRLEWRQRRWPQYRKNHPVHEKRGYHGLNRLSLPGETHANPEAIICPTTPHLPLGVADVSKLWRPAGRLQLSGLG